MCTHVIMFEYVKNLILCKYSVNNVICKYLGPLPYVFHLYLYLGMLYRSAIHVCILVTSCLKLVGTLTFNSHADIYFRRLIKVYDKVSKI